MKGTMILSPGSSVAWKRPSRSTTQAFCCGTTRTPSITNTTASARMKNGTAYTRVGSNTAMTAVRTKTARILGSIDTSLTLSVGSSACASARANPAGSCGAGFGDFEGVAIGGTDVEHFAGFTCALTNHARVPGRAAVAHAGKVV